MSIITSLDPRINRLSIPSEFDNAFPDQDEKDQFITYQVFVQPKEQKPYQHEGIVHAPTEEMAFLFAKEQFSRRGMSCSGIWVIKTTDIQVSPITENGEDIYDYINKEIMEGAEKGNNALYQIFQLVKRGKQHIHAGDLEAHSPQEALWNAKNKFASEKPVLNLWLVKDNQILKIEGEEFNDIWNTLPDKKYRDAMDYKATEKIKKFKEEQKA